MVKRTRRTDEFRYDAREFIDAFAKKNRLTIVNIVPYQFENMSRDSGFIVDFGTRGILNFDTCSVYDNSRFGGQTRLIEEGKIRYSTGYAASGKLDGKLVTMSVNIERSNIKAPEGWGKTKEAVKRIDNHDYWFYRAAR